MASRAKQAVHGQPCSLMLAGGIFLGRGQHCRQHRPLHTLLVDLTQAGLGLFGCLQLSDTTAPLRLQILSCKSHVILLQTGEIP